MSVLCLAFRMKVGRAVNSCVGLKGLGFRVLAFMKYVHAVFQAFYGAIRHWLRMNPCCGRSCRKKTMRSWSFLNRATLIDKLLKPFGLRCGVKGYRRLLLDCLRTFRFRHGVLCRFSADGFGPRIQ